MTDPRFSWIKYLTQSSQKTIFVIPKGFQRFDLNSHQGIHNTCTTIKMLTGLSNISTFVPLYRNTILSEDFELIFYVVQTRESSKNIQRKLALEGQNPIIEYSIFPSIKNPKWFIPKWRTLGFGKMSRMIQPSSFIAKTAVFLLRALKKLDQTDLVFPCRLIVANRKNINLKNKRSLINFYQNETIGIKSGIVYTGSYGPLQKFTIELLKKDQRPFAYAKFGQNKYTHHAIENEKSTLLKLQTIQLRKIKIPELLHLKNTSDKFSEQLLLIKTLEGGKPLVSISPALIDGLVELHNTTKQTYPTVVKEYINKQLYLIQKQQSYISETNRSLKEDIVTILKHLLDELKSTDTFPLSLSHGDFTRWNIRVGPNSIYVIDWEEAAMRPPGHDLLSFFATEYFLALQMRRKKATQMLLSQFSNQGTFYGFIKKIKFSDSNFNVDNDLLGICFFSEIFRSNLWHIRKHQEHGYPSKKSLSHLLEMAWECCIKLNNRRKGIIT